MCRTLPRKPPIEGEEESMEDRDLEQGGTRRVQVVSVDGLDVGRGMLRPGAALSCGDVPHAAAGAAD